ncbi:MAG: GCN5-related N-acetyltransferase [Firmicutes bacterium]|nr:GCN5-related N-acetyltransferase [Bacillota bacterium]
MKEYKGLVFQPLQEESIDELTAVMTRAFDEDSRIHLGKDKGGPTGYDSGDFLRRWGLDKKATAYQISMEGKLIGGLILWINPKTKINYLGCIFVDTNLQNKGIGRTIWEFVEKEYPDTKIWRTETPGFSRRNHNFYVNKLGFHVMKIEKPMDAEESSFLLEKDCRASKGSLK